MTAIISLLEILLFCLGATLLIHRPDVRISESISLGIILAFLALSFIFQLVFLIGQPNLAFFLEAMLLVWLFSKVRKKAKYLRIIGQRINSFWTQYKILTSLVCLAWVYLGLQAILLPPSNWDSMTYNLARVLLFQQEKTLLLTNVTNIWQSIYPLGSDILPHIFLRFYTDYGIGIFSFLSYLSVVFGTYALSRRYTSTEVSLTATLVILSLPELVYQATSTKNDIVACAMAVFCFLTVHRLLECLNITDLVIFILGLFWGISVKTTWIGFGVPFCILFSILLLQKYPFRDGKHLIFSNWRILIPFGVPVLIFSQFWLFIHNIYVWGSWSGTREFNELTKQTDGLTGALANIVRYIFHSIDVLEIGNAIARRLIGLSFTEFLQKIYDSFIYPVFGNAATNDTFGPFRLSWWSHEDMAWFGPFGFLIVIPAILYSTIKGQKFLRASSLTLLTYVFILCYTLTWTPFHNRYLSIFFGASGGCVAYFIQIFSKKMILLILVKYISIMILFFACSVNAAKPFITLDKSFTNSNINAINLPYVIFKNSIWGKTNLGTNRLYYAEAFFGDSRVQESMKLLPRGSRVALVADSTTWVYNYLLQNPQVEFIPVQQRELESKASNFEYILCLDVQCDFNQAKLNKAILWTAKPSAKKGQLIRVSKAE
ncbi:hypothetical protein ACE1CI_01055 [Aerosakkonemataceae cyanobacterium BLCC-F50]|uniref:Glycosyltransferase RgtA/B/C/D-like domain-containing protein n=1 Tax=Floridaenema flaviceps BLCC-F50 TaxID=3153642 RepID=A0ABV4XII3_9CYAN